jgi:hypothetical protein
MAVKKRATCNAPYASRVSLGFAYSLALRDKLHGEAPDILRELDILEGIRSRRQRNQCSLSIRLCIRSGISIFIPQATSGPTLADGGGLEMAGMMI